MTATRALRRIPWPLDSVATPRCQPRVGVVVANFNTRRLIAQLVFSLYRLLGPNQFAQLVIVDNASTDRSRELLNGLHAARLIHLIRNRSQRYHGPALTQGISWLARRQQNVRAPDRLDYVWVLDSDVVVLRPDAVCNSIEAVHRFDAAAVGQKSADPTYDQMLRHNPHMLQLFSLMLDPARLWRPPTPPFVEDGAPSTALQIAADARGLRLVDFPFIEERYLLHLGRGTLSEIAETSDTDHRYYDWATKHHGYHFTRQASGPDLYREFCEMFDAEVGDLTTKNLVEACRRSELLRMH